MKEGEIREGFEEGKWTFWDEDGKKNKEATYHNGEVKSEKLFN
jgi:antitoxin component YwqK of YwqJK toxin-antitoxin module